MDKYTQEYFLYLAASKNISKNTYASYTGDIKNYLDYLDKADIDDPSCVNQTIILNYMLLLKKQGRSSSTISRKLSSVKSFYNFLFDRRYISEKPTNDLHCFKFEKNPPQALDQAQIDLYLSMPVCKNIKGYRDKALLEVMYATGMRATDIINLRVSDVNLNVGYIFHNSKGKERIIPIYSLAKECVRNYIEKRKLIQNSGSTDILFLNLNGKPLSRQGLYKIVKYYQIKAKIPIEITPNTLRDSFAIHLLENGADLKSVQEMMGHNDISSTRVYERVVKNKLTEVYQKAHPRSNHK